MGDVGVSISEIVEVRGDTLCDEELLALIILGCEALADTGRGVFSPDQVFVHSNGDLEIKAVDINDVDAQYVPPELRIDTKDIDQGAVHVFCLGEVVRFAGGAESGNADIFSLLNVMTVAHVGTRPSIIRLAQMAKNKLNIQNPKALLIEMYILVMGDEADDIDDFEISSGEYVLDSVGEEGELKRLEVNENESPSSLPANGIIPDGKIVVSSRYEHDNTDEVPSKVAKKDLDNTDDFENSVATERVSTSRLKKQSTLHESISAENNEEQEQRKGKVRQQLLNPTDMLLISSSAGSIDSKNNDNIRKKSDSTRNRGKLDKPNLTSPSMLDVVREESEERNIAFSKGMTARTSATASWGDMKSRRDAFDYDDDIVTYEGDIIEPFSVRQTPSLLERDEANVRETCTGTPNGFSNDRNNDGELGHAVSTSESGVSPCRDIVDTNKDPVQSQNLDESVLPSHDFIGTFETNPRNTSVESKKEGEAERFNLQTTRFQEEVNETNDVKSFSPHVDVVVLDKTDNRPLTENAQPSTAVEANHRMPTPSVNSSLNSSTIQNNEEKEGTFKRHNSLVPSRISGRKSSLRHPKRNASAVPEFIANANSTSICLRASAQKKKKVTLHRVEQTDVTVELLNGKRIEVSCRSDAVTSEVADTVMRHVNFNENFFFGLAVIKDGEYFFLESRQKLEKLAPPGWKNARSQHQKNLYILYLRFQFYPAVIDFVKTDVVLHELYLQLRRDLLADLLQSNDDRAIELAALALQAECADRPSAAVLDYFKLEHYMPSRHITACDENVLRRKIVEMHGRLKGLDTRKAERRFVLICQSLSDYGAHFHRVFTTKPSSNLGNTPLGDPETGTPQWIGILPRGIVQYREQRGGREAVLEHLWQDTKTLQFDKKRFVIVSDKHEPAQQVFYTDHYTKSSYFVRFAALQHQFMIKMRTWNLSVQSDGKSAMQAVPDVAAEYSYKSSTLPSSRQESFVNQNTVNQQSPVHVHDRKNEFGESRVRSLGPPKRSEQQLDDSIISPTTKFEANNNESINGSLNEAEKSALLDESSEATDGERFDVELEKDPQLGLGLTLVDGNLNGVKGVYVKLVAEGGAGMKCGLNVGDRLMSVNNVSLIGKDRHATVDLVKKSGPIVHLSVFRLEAVATELAAGKPKQERRQLQSEILDAGASRQLNSTAISNRSRTPPATRKEMKMLKRRQRAVSDFGAVGDMLPELKTDDFIDIMRQESRLKLVEQASSSEDETENDKNVYKVPASSMYKFDGMEEDDGASSQAHNKNVQPSQKLSFDERLLRTQKRNEKKDNGWVNSPPTGFPTSKLPSKNEKSSSARSGSNLDWTDDLSDLSEEKPADMITVRLDRNETGSLGVQIASVAGSVYVKQLTAEPAISNPEIKIGDKVVQINGQSTANLVHQQVVDLLRKGGRTVLLGLQRMRSESPPHSDVEKTIKVVLEKSPTGSLGLSLAKKTGLDGIFIRMIGTGSAADLDGSLRIGDKIWEINGKPVHSWSPGAIVDMLKSATNPVEIVVKREVHR